MQVGMEMALEAKRLSISAASQFLILPLIPPTIPPLLSANGSFIPATTINASPINPYPGLPNLFIATLTWLIDIGPNLSSCCSATPITNLPAFSGLRAI